MADTLYQPPEEFSKRASVSSMEQYRDIYRRATEDPEGFWGQLAEKELHWFKKWSQVLEWEAPFAKWFVGGKTNISYNCLDRHLLSWRKNKAAIIWEGEPGDERVLTYQELHRRVARFANVLKQLGLKTGDRSIIYMPMVPEASMASTFSRIVIVAPRLLRLSLS